MPSFPTTPVLDDFNRADEHPLNFGGRWGASLSGDGAEERVIGNRAGIWNSGTGQLWQDALFGPDCEVYYDLPVAGTSFFHQLWLRVTSPGSSYNGYLFLATVDGGLANTFNRIDAGVSTQLGASLASTFADGDSIGANAIGPTLTLYRKTGGVWTPLGSRTDATYATAGYISFMPSATGSLGDNFGGGTYADIGTLGQYPTRHLGRGAGW